MGDDRLYTVEVEGLGTVRFKGLTKAQFQGIDRDMVSLRFDDATEARLAELARLGVPTEVARRAELVLRRAMVEPRGAELRERLPDSDAGLLTVERLVAAILDHSWPKAAI